MTLPQVEDILEDWKETPPVNEMLASLARSYFGYDAKPMTLDELRKQQEAKWASGAYMSPAEILKAMNNGAELEAPDLDDMGGIGPFPGNR